MRKMGVQCFVREELASNQEIEEEKQATVTRTNGGVVTLTALRLTFFRDRPPSMAWRNLAGMECLGYAVLITLTLPDNSKRPYILESVIRFPSLWTPTESAGVQANAVTNYYLHSCREFETVIGKAKENLTFRVNGSFFCQQNDLTHVCAHAALRMGINSSPAFTGPKLTNKFINDQLGIDHSEAEGKRIGKYSPEAHSVGLSTEQIVCIVNKLGWKEHVAEFDLNPDIDYEAFIYPLIESGCPTILGVHNPATAHVLAVLGHTLNSDRWTPEARLGYGAFPITPYISTSAWADHFIVNDDNFGMYVTLPAESIRNILVPKHNPNLHAALAIGLVPPDVTISGYGAEQAAAGLAEKLVRLTDPTPQNRWLHLLKHETHECKPTHDASQRLVCRTLLCKRQEYLGIMKTVEDDKGNRLTPTEIQTLEKILPERFWVTEITVPNLYTGNKRKLGDILTPAKGTGKEFLTGAMMLFFWFPGLSWHEPLTSMQGWSLFGHIPLLRGASQSKQLLEW
ncbi:MAG TPA: hypothetical protein VN887_03240 [Candidatus Angelobacter sp.]|nr:hypothetical protein [Candidatus Angelobacter sp.]